MAEEIQAGQTSTGESQNTPEPVSPEARMRAIAEKFAQQNQGHRNAIQTALTSSKDGQGGLLSDLDVKTLQQPQKQTTDDGDSIPDDEPIETSTQTQTRAQKRIRQLVDKAKALETQLQEAKMKHEVASLMLQQGRGDRTSVSPDTQDELHRSQSDDDGQDDELLKFLGERFEDQDAADLKTILQLQRKQIMEELQPVLEQHSTDKNKSAIQQLAGVMKQNGHDLTPDWEQAIAEVITKDPYISKIKDLDPVAALIAAYKQVAFEVLVSTRKSQQTQQSLPRPAPGREQGWLKPSEGQGTALNSQLSHGGSKTQQWAAAVIAAKRNLGMA